MDGVLSGVGARVWSESFGALDAAEVVYHQVVVRGGTSAFLLLSGGFWLLIEHVRLTRVEF